MKKSLLLIFSLFLLLPTFAQQTVGLFSKTAASEDGYVLFPPMRSLNTYLIDKCGKQVHTWTSSYEPGFSAYLTSEGMLLRPANVHNSYFVRGGSGGLIEEMDWNGNHVWSYTISSGTECQHHDAYYLPNGNILTIAWELKTDAEAIAAGRDPKNIGFAFWPDKILELKPTGLNTANVVWEWHAWDHTIQDFDSTLPNFGVVSDHPELLNINQSDGNETDPDWLHINTVTYNKDLDQIMLSCFYFNEVWIIDHSTSTVEAQSHMGGRYGKGGDLLYRWGNPQTYGRGTAADQKFFRLHDAHWIPPGYPDSGKIIVFNNGDGRPQGSYSSVDIIDPPVDPSGNYTLGRLLPYGPGGASWSYRAPNPTDFYSALVSGVDRLKGGNTLICDGNKGTLFEIDKNGNTVWDYVNPAGLGGSTAQGHIPVQGDIFRARQYPASYSGFKNRTLTATVPIELLPTPGPCDKVSPAGVGQTLQEYAGFQAVNPIGDRLFVQSGTDEKDVQLRLFNAMGMLCGEWKTDFRAGNMTPLEMPGQLPGGAYFLHVIQGSSQTTLKLSRN